MKRIFLLMAAIPALAGLAAPLAADPFAGIGGVALSAAEAAAIDGGDVYMALDESRTRLTVKVYDNEYEARLGRIGPKETYTVDAHNRVVATTEAPFFPAGASDEALRGKTGLTTKPAEFPAGTWRVGAPRPRADAYGPWMIGTEAVGTVEVYSGGAKVGEARDSGYAIHSSAKAFDRSRSWGCVIVKPEDNERIARTLLEDRRSAPRDRPARQLFSVRPRP